jgi:hypothetical protein
MFPQDPFRLFILPWWSANDSISFVCETDHYSPHRQTS